MSWIPHRTFWKTLIFAEMAVGCAGLAVARDQGGHTMEPLVVEATHSHLPLTNTSSPFGIPGEMLRDLNMLTARQAMARVPNVFVAQSDSARASSFSVRGSREVTFHEMTGGRAGVGFYLDDIPCMDAYGRDLTMFDVESLRVFKGPHGAAFGAPHSMGMVDVTTRPPGPGHTTNFAVTAGSHHLHTVEGNISGPLADNLFLGLDGLFSQDDGWFKDRITGHSYGAHETSSGRARLRWLPNESLELTLTAGWSGHDDDPAVFLRPDRAGDFYQVFSSPDAYANGSQAYQALSALWKADGWQLKSITSHRRSEFDDHDPVFLQEIFGAPNFPRTRLQDVTAWTQEVRLESTDPDADWRWRAGMFLNRWDSVMDHHMLGLGPWEGDNRFDYQQDDASLYGESTHRLGDQLELTGGLRLQTTRNHTLSDYRPTALASFLGGTPLNLDQSGTTNAILPMAAAAWNWTKTHRSYARVSTAVQPGGEAIAAAGSGPYSEERSLHCELGHEARMFDDTVHIHIAVFRSDYHDYQSFQFNPAGQTVFNAERAHAWGAEAELRIQPWDGFECFAGAGWTRARYDEFITPTANFSGNHIENIPTTTANVGAACRAPWGGMARLEWLHIGDTCFDPGNSIRQGSYGLLSARVGYENAGYGVYLFASNLLDKQYHTQAYLFQGIPAAAPGVPRMIGVEMRAEF